MTTLGVVFLGIIALCALVQAAFFLVAARAVLQVTARMDALADRADREWPEIARRLSEVTSEVADAARTAQATAERAQQLIDMLASGTERASAVARKAAELPLVPLRAGGALWRALRHAISVYRTPAPENAR